MECVVDARRARLLHLHARVMERRVAFLLHLAVVHQRALAGHNFRDRVGERRVFLQAQEGFDNAGLAGITNQDQIARVRNGGPAAAMGNLQNVQRLLEHRALGHFDKSAIFKKCGVERDEGMGLRVRVTPQMPLQQRAMVFPSGGQAACPQSLGNFPQFRELRNVATVKKGQAAATQIGQRQALNLLPKFFRQLHACRHKRRGGQRRDIGVDPLLVVSRRETKFGKTLNGRMAKLGQPSRRILIEGALQAREG